MAFGTQDNQALPVFDDHSGVELTVSVYGISPHCIQTMWNAVDDWVRRFSNYYSLFELYGHFTEPHPIFTITDFQSYSKHPIMRFARHISDFSNCSRYLGKEDLLNTFKGVFDVTEFGQLMDILRQFRFDIRSHETNIAIPPDVYMVAYPFTLPERKQMNFAVNTRSAHQVVESYVNYVRRDE